MAGVGTQGCSVGCPSHTKPWTCSRSVRTPPLLEAARHGLNGPQRLPGIEGVLTKCFAFVP